AKHGELQGELMSINKKSGRSYQVRFLITLMIGAVAMSAGASLVSGYNTTTGILVPPSYTTFQPPAAGGSYTDPVFGTAIKRISDAMHTASVAGGMVTTISNEYSSMSAFNKDNTRLLIQYLSYFALYDGAGNYIKDLYQWGI